MLQETLISMHTDPSLTSAVTGQCDHTAAFHWCDLNHKCMGTEPHRREGARYTMTDKRARDALTQLHHTATVSLHFMHSADWHQHLAGVAHFKEEVTALAT